jgi:hypothetical protein
LNSHIADRIALLIAIIGLVVTGFVAERVYERIPHIEDEFAFLWEAQVMARGQISTASPEHEKSFLVPFVVDYDGRRFGKYPPGWPAALSLGARLDVAGWINPLISALVLWLTYRLARKILNPELSLLAELLMLSSPMFLMLSGTLMAHMFSLLLTLSFMLAWSDIYIPTRGSASVPVWMKVFVAGGSLGLLFLTRPLTALAVALPFLINSAMSFMQLDRRARAASLGVFAIGALIGSLLALWQWVLTGDMWTNPYTLWWPYDRIGFGPGIGVTESGHNLSLAYYNTRFSLRAGVHDLFGWPYLSWVLLPFGLIGMRKHRWTWLHAGIFVSLVLAYSFYWIGSWLYGPRYYFEALAGLSILSAGGFGWIGGWLSKDGRWIRVRRLSSPGILAILMLGNLLLYTPRRVGGMKGLYDIDRQSSARFLIEDPYETLIIIRASRWFLYARYLYQVEPFESNPLLLAWSRGSVKDEALARSFPEKNIYYYDVESGVLTVNQLSDY